MKRTGEYRTDNGSLRAVTWMDGDGVRTEYFPKASQENKVVLLSGKIFRSFPAECFPPGYYQAK